MDNLLNCIWIFNGERANFPSGVFARLTDAESWIARHKLSGVLTSYPVGIGAYDYAVEKGLFTPKKEDQKTPMFIGKFSCAGFEHYHYENGNRA